MLLVSKDGIECDLCAAISKSKFVYYSYDWTSMTVSGKNRTPPVKMTSMDVCEQCYATMAERCLKHINKFINNKIKCDMCELYMSGSFKYYRCVITKVVVDSSIKPEGPLEIINKHMDFNVCEHCKAEIDTKVNEISKARKSRGGWQ